MSVSATGGGASWGASHWGDSPSPYLGEGLGGGLSEGVPTSRVKFRSPVRPSGLRLGGERSVIVGDIGYR